MHKYWEQARFVSLTITGSVSDALQHISYQDLRAMEDLFQEADMESIELDLLQPAVYPPEASEIVELGWVNLIA